MSKYSHRSNLIQKGKRSLKARDDVNIVLREVRKSYVRYIRSINWNHVRKGDVEEAVHILNSYLDFAKEVESKYSFFNWRSDFAGSIIPEFLHLIFECRLSHLDIPHFFSTRGSVVDISLQGVSGNVWNVRKKNQDLCLGGAICKTVINDIEEIFVVPSIIFEVKTNIDINKLNGLDFSAEKLKRSFPAAKYFLVTETVDFSLEDNYSSSSLDEIYCLRTQVRSAARRKKDPLNPAVFKSLLDDVADYMQNTSSSKGHVYSRLAAGVLING